MSTTLHLLDVAIVVAYLAALAVVGVYFSRRQTDLNHPLRDRVRTDGRLYERC